MNSMSITRVLKFVNLALLLFVVAYAMYYLFTGAYYSHPNAEDFSLTSKSKSEGIIDGAIYFLNSYDGRYFTNILHGINPLAFGYVQAYKWTIAFGIIFFYLSVYYFFQSINNGRDKRNSMLFSGLFVAIHFALSPSIVHEVYWMVSSFVYMYCWCFVLLWLASVIQYLNTDSEKWKKIHFSLAALFLVCCIGINEMMLVLNSFLLFVLGIYIFIYRKEAKIALVLWAILGLCSIVFFISCPGISHRFGSFEQEHQAGHYTEIIQRSFSHFSSELVHYLNFGAFSITLLLIVLLQFKNTLGLSQKIEIPLKFKLGVFLSALFTLYLMTYAYYIPMGHADFLPFRIYTSVWTGIQLLFIIALPLLILSSIDISKYLKAFGKEFLLLLSYIILIYALLNTDNSIQRLKEDYESGEMQAYSEEMKQRYRLLNSEHKNGICYNKVVLPKLINKPSTIYNNPDILPNREAFYWNESYEAFFGVQEVSLEGDSVDKKRLLKELIHGY